ncbi:MAG TPA: AI-2E family transporter [Candidatus Magasanikbacteria bacterium]|nr:AI-2E family transporter [Candidatus Magasanikbacteria bacterium]
MEKKVTIISFSSFLKALAIVLFLGLVYLIWDILLLFLIALLVAALILPLVDWASKKKIPRSLTVLLLYVVFFGVFIGVIALLIPPIVSQFSQLSANYGAYKDKLINLFSWFKDIGLHYGFWEPLSKFIPETFGTGIYTAQKFMGSIFGIFAGVGSLFLVLVMTFYIVAEEDNFKKLIKYFTPSEYQPYFSKLWAKIKEKLSLWIRGQLLLDLIVGLLSYFGLLAIGVPYALLLGVLSGLFESIPYAGPIFSSIVAVILTILQTGDWFKGLLVLGLFVIIQQLENNLLVPKIMQKAAGVNPIVSILSLLVGYRLLGVVGAILAIPLMTIVSVIWVEIIAWRTKSQKV